MKIRHIVIAALLLVLGGVSYGGYRLYHYSNVTVPNAYAAWSTGDLVIEYIQANDDQWPTSWDDLEPYYDGPYWGNDFEDLQERVQIDWVVDVQALREMPGPPDDLITLTNGKKTYWGSGDPNELVWDYLTDPNDYHHADPLTAETPASADDEASQAAE